MNIVIATFVGDTVIHVEYVDINDEPMRKYYLTTNGSMVISENEFYLDMDFTNHSNSNLIKVNIVKEYLRDEKLKNILGNDTI